MPPIQSWTRLRSALKQSGDVFLRDLVSGFGAVSHNSLAAFGLAVLTVCVVLGSRADLRASLEDRAVDWLLARQEARYQRDDNEVDVVEATAIDRATAADPSQLNRQQAAAAQWLSRRYRVAIEPVSALVQEAWSVGAKAKLDPALILAVMAIESSFNPFAQSPVGAQGLMQVMTRVHDDKYEAFGGNHAAFDPLTNLRVGVAVLQECISRAGGSTEGGLKLYVGAAAADDGGYASKVIAEAQFLREVIRGRTVPFTVKLPAPAAEPVRAAAAPTVAAATPAPVTPEAAPAPRLASALVVPATVEPPAEPSSPHH